MRYIMFQEKCSVLFGMMMMMTVIFYLLLFNFIFIII